MFENKAGLAPPDFLPSVGKTTAFRVRVGVSLADAVVLVLHWIGLDLLQFAGEPNSSVGYWLDESTL